jgi:hypothetical protein
MTTASVISHQGNLAADIAQQDISESERGDDQRTHATQSPKSKHLHKDVRFWGIMVALCIASLLGGVETTIVTTSLPTIVHELSIGDDYVRITNMLFLTR